MLELTPAMDLTNFSADYASARQRFFVGQKCFAVELMRSLESHEHPLQGPQGEALACDVLQLGRQDEAQRLLVLISATHGVEGFAGSAIQCDCLPLLQPLLQQHPGLAVVVIHAINPWGFAWLRRYDHEGIDLNRNFIDFSAPLPDSPGYEEVHPRLMAADEVSADGIKSFCGDMEYADFVDAVTHGQYDHADGLFYGGRAPSWSRGVLETITAAPVFASAERMAVIDLHTGLGPYGYGEVINDHPLHSTGFQWVQQWYGDNARSTELGESVSGVKQGLLDYHWHELMGERGCFVTLEFGTYSGEQLLASLINEQQLQNKLTQSGGSRDISHEHIQELRRFFCPAEKSWQQQVLFRGRQVIAMALEGLLR